MMLCTCNFLKNNVSALETKFKNHILTPWHRNNAAQPACLWVISSSTGLSRVPLVGAMYPLVGSLLKGPLVGIMHPSMGLVTSTSWPPLDGPTVRRK